MHARLRADTCAALATRARARADVAESWAPPEPAPVRSMFIPPPANHSGKIGFPTYAMWGLCVVVVGVCYVLESKLDDGVPATKAMPAEVELAWDWRTKVFDAFLPTSPVHLS